MAYRATAVAIAIALISCTPVAVGYVVRPSCRKMPGAYEMFDSIFAMSWLGVIPHLLMLVFGFLTFLNIRRSKQQIKGQMKTNSATENQRRKTLRKTDSQLITVSYRST